MDSHGTSGCPAETTRPSRFQFRLSTLLIGTTILCLHFAIAAVNPLIALVVGSFSISIAIIVCTRFSFGHEPALVGLCSIIGSPIATGLLFLAVAPIHWLGGEFEEPPHNSPELFILVALYCAFLGFIPGTVSAVVYWVLHGIRSHSSLSE